MAKILTFQMELSEEEAENFLARIGERSSGPVVTSPAEDDEGPTNTAAPDTDKNGVPWSADIHASTKALNADGTWRRKRGVDAAVADAYEAQFKAAPAPVEAAPAPAEAAPAPVEAEAAPAPAMPTGLPGMALPEPAAPVAPEPVSYESLVDLINGVISDNKLTVDQMGPIYAEAGVTNVQDLLTNETLRANLKAKVLEKTSA